MIPITRPLFTGDENKRIASVIESGWVTQGPRTAEFERQVAGMLDRRHGVATSNCTAALHLLLLVAGVQPGDEVIVPSLTFIATINAISHSGGAPVFVDVDERTANIDPLKVEAAITPRTKAVLAVHQLGYPADLVSLSRIAERAGIALLEDAACALGSKYLGRLVGSGSSPACFSFHPRKVITTAEGGLVVLDDEAMTARLRKLRNQGMSISDLDRHSSPEVLIETYDEVGFNYRMTDLHAELGLAQLEILDRCVAARRRLAARYTTAFAEIKGVAPPYEGPDVEFNYQSYMVRVTSESAVSRDELMTLLLKDGIATRRGVMASHKEPPYADRRADLPVTDAIAGDGLLIPLFPDLSESDQDYVLERIAIHVSGAS